MIIVVQNDERVPAGTIEQFLQANNAEFRIVRLFAGDALGPPVDASGVVVLGGRMGVSDTTDFPFLENLKTWIRKAGENEIPILGICLGGQLIAEIFGGQVHRQSNGEHGCREIQLLPEGCTDPMFLQIPKKFISFQWHSDSFTPPPGAIRLAASSQCPFQAFRYGKSTWALQFHPEVTENIADIWSRRHPERKSILQELHRVADRYDRIAERLFDNFLAYCRSTGIPAQPEGSRSGRMANRK